MDSILIQRYVTLHESSETVQYLPGFYTRYPSTAVERRVSTQTVFSDATLNVASPYGPHVETKHVAHLRRAVQESLHSRRS
jgi:hypothetical protein